MIQENKKIVQQYLEIIGFKETKLINTFTPFLNRLQNISFFCGQQYAYSGRYQFLTDISRYLHSISVASQIDQYTNGDEKQVLAALFHDAGTPIFSHVIDYLKEDYLTQEATEDYNQFFFQNKELQALLSSYHLTVADVLNAKKYPLVDNNRPKLCIDRLDGILLASLVWTRYLSFDDISQIIQDISFTTNEENEPELAFHTETQAKKLLEAEIVLNQACHSKEDNYSMFLLRDITKRCLEQGYLEEKDLHHLTEPEAVSIIESYASSDSYLYQLWHQFQYQDQIPKMTFPDTKQRIINPLMIDQPPHRLIK